MTGADRAGDTEQNSWTNFILLLANSASFSFFVIRNDGCNSHMGFGYGTGRVAAASFAVASASSAVLPPRASLLISSRPSATGCLVLGLLPVWAGDLGSDLGVGEDVPVHAYTISLVLLGVSIPLLTDFWWELSSSLWVWRRSAALWRSCESLGRSGFQSPWLPSVGVS